MAHSHPGVLSHAARGATRVETGEHDQGRPGLRRDGWVPGRTRIDGAAIRLTRILAIAQPTRGLISCRIYLNTRKAPLFPVLNFTVTQTALFVKYTVAEPRRVHDRKRAAGARSHRNRAM